MPSLINAHLMLLCIYYSFNISFPKENNNMLTFIQKILMDHQDSVKKNLNVVKLYTKLYFNKIYKNIIYILFYL